MLKRVLEKNESLRNVAEDSGISQETRRRAARCGYKASFRTDRPRSQHRWCTRRVSCFFFIAPISTGLSYSH